MQPRIQFNASSIQALVPFPRNTYTLCPIIHPAHHTFPPAHTRPRFTLTTPAPSPAQIYNDYFGPAMFTPWAKNLVEQSTPSAGERVLDLASGTGLLTEQITPHLGESGSIVGLDFAPPMLAVARNRSISGPSVEWVEASADAIPLPDDSVDRVYCQQGFQFFPDRAKAASEVKRVLKPGGSLAISLWASVDEIPLWHQMFKSISSFLDVPMDVAAKPFTFGGSAPIQTMLEDAGFSDIDITKRSSNSVFGPPESFVKLTVMGAAAAIPAFGELSDEEKQSLIARVESENNDLIESAVQNGNVNMGLTSFTATATA